MTKGREVYEDPGLPTGDRIEGEAKQLLARSARPFELTEIRQIAGNYKDENTGKPKPFWIFGILFRANEGDTPGPEDEWSYDAQGRLGEHRSLSIGGGNEQRDLKYEAWRRYLLANPEDTIEDMVLIQIPVKNRNHAPMWDIVDADVPMEAPATHQPEPVATAR